jgi:hypothetical protein
MAERLPPALAAVLAAVPAAVLAAPLAACYSPNAPYGAPCVTDGDCPSGQSCAAETSTCAPPGEQQVWRDDSAADFGLAGAYTEEVSIEPAGFVGPAAYFAGGVRLSGIDRNAIADQQTPWSELAALPRAGTSFARGLELDFSDAPLGLGLTKGDDIAILVEGEIYLDMAGAWRFELTANDIGFFELAPPTSSSSSSSSASSFTRVVADQNVATTGTYDVPGPGWYRFRGAFADAAGTAAYELRYDSPGPGNLRHVPASVLRAPAGDVSGMIVDGFEDPFLIGPVGSILEAGTLAGISFQADPFGLPVGNSSLSLRFSTQVLIDAAGDYALRIQSSQGHRAWLDGRSVADKLDVTPQTTVTAATALEPGWHDLVVDLNRISASSSQLDVTVAAGPTWVGQAIPSDHLRPVVGRATRWAGDAAAFTSAIPDGGTLTRTVGFDVPPDLMATRIDTQIKLNHGDLMTVEIKLDPPVGLTVTQVTAGALTGNGGYSRHGTMPASTAGGSWGFLVSDTAAGDNLTGSVTYAGVTVLGSGGPAPFSGSYRYVSAPRDLGEVTAFSPIKWGLRQAGPASKVTVSLRSCDAEAACAEEPWTAVTEGAYPAVRPRRFAQYMVEVSGTDDIPTALDWIEIGYRTPRS